MNSPLGIFFFFSETLRYETIIYALTLTITAMKLRRHKIHQRSIPA
jgi:hypothetical protein